MGKYNWLFFYIRRYLTSLMTLFLFYILPSTTLAAEVRTLGDMALTITGSFEQFGLLITAASYLAGLGFSIGAVLKFKQHKDNPTQIPIGTPIALIFISAALLFMPSVINVTSKTLFGPEGGQTAGPSGIIITSP